MAQNNAEAKYFEGRLRRADARLAREPDTAHKGPHLAHARKTPLVSLAHRTDVDIVGFAPQL